VKAAVTLPQDRTAGRRPAAALTDVAERALADFRRTLERDRGSLPRRLAKAPARVLGRLAFRLLARGGIVVPVPARMFWGERMRVLMPEGFAYIRHGYYEPELTELLVRTLRPGMRFVDVGAHFGYYSLLASRLVGPTGLVESFEPIPRTFRVLAHNVRHRTNVTARPAAVFSREGEIDMYDMGPRFAGYSSFAAPRVDGAEVGEVSPRKLRVASVTLDGCARDWPPRPTFIKIDAESAESHVFAGMDRTLERLRPVVAFEVGDFELSDVPRSRDLILDLARRGYTAYQIRGGRLQPHEVRDTYAPGSIVAVPRGQTVFPEAP
jgi:FkbM family methyltransferase